MTEKTDRKKTDVMVTALDMGSMVERGQHWYDVKFKAAYPRKHNAGYLITIHRGLRWGLVEGKDGFYFLCDEGVGEKKLSLEDTVAISMSCSKGGEPTVVPTFRYHVTIKEILAFKTAERVNLEVWVKSGSERLDENYEQWRETLEA